MPLDPSIPALSGVLAAISLDQVDPLQVAILVYLYHKGAATTTSILNFVNTIERHTGTQLRTQSGVSHSITRLVARNYIHRDHGEGYYRNTIHGYDIAASFVRLSGCLEQDYSSLQKTINKMQSAHVE